MLVKRVWITFEQQILWLSTNFVGAISAGLIERSVSTRHCLEP